MNDWAEHDARVRLEVPEYPQSYVDALLARIAEMEAELATLRDISDAWGYYRDLLTDARARLTVVIALCDEREASYETLEDVRAAATGETSA